MGGERGYACSALCCTEWPEPVKKAGGCDDDRNAPRTVGPVTLGFLLRLLPRTFGLNFPGADDHQLSPRE